MIGPLFADTSERRDRVQIFADIIKVSAQPVKITKILRAANVQYNTFQECINKLCGAGLLEMIPVLKRRRSKRDMRTTYVYKATDGGLRWCGMVDEIYDTIDGVYEMRETPLQLYGTPSQGDSLREGE